MEDPSADKGQGYRTFIKRPPVQNTPSGTEYAELIKKNEELQSRNDQLASRFQSQQSSMPAGTPQTVIDSNAAQPAAEPAAQPEPQSFDSNAPGYVPPIYKTNAPYVPW